MEHDWRKKQSDLNREIEILLDSLSEESDLHNLAREALVKAATKPTTSENTVNIWPLLPLSICEAISGDYGQVLPLAAAFQFFYAAGDVFDDIEDADFSEYKLNKHNIAIAVNVATTLLILAEKAITRLKARNVTDDMITRTTDIINSYYTVSCMGQHLDLSSNMNNIITEEEYLKIVNMKSAHQIECGCYLGALLASNNQKLADMFASFGNNLGMAAQIVNDVRGITNKRDIINRNLSLPIIFALSHTTGNTHVQLEKFFFEHNNGPIDANQIKAYLFTSGAVQYSVIKIGIYKQQALDILHEIEKDGVQTEQLKRFLE